MQGLTYISIVGKDMCSTLIVDNSCVKVNLRHLDRMRGRAVKVKAFVDVLGAFLAVSNMSPVHVLKVDTIPATGELDVDFQFCNMKFHS